VVRWHLVGQDESLTPNGPMGACPEWDKVPNCTNLEVSSQAFGFEVGVAGQPSIGRHPFSAGEWVCHNASRE